MWAWSRAKPAGWRAARSTGTWAAELGGGGSSFGGAGLDRMAAVAPDADAATDVDDVEAGALEDRGGEAAAFATAADRRDLAIARQLGETAAEVAIGDVERAGDVLARVLGLVADVEDDRALTAVDPAGQLVGIDQLDPVHRPFLRAPGGHP